MTLEQDIKSFALRLGFDRVGIAGVERFARDEAATVERVREGLMDGLAWYTEERVRRMNRPAGMLDGARSIIALAMSYKTDDPPAGDGKPRGKVARYAWGRDYQ